MNLSAYLVHSMLLHSEKICAILRVYLHGAGG